MIDTPAITRAPEQLVAAIHLVIPRSEIQSVMGPALGEIHAAIRAQGLEPTGPWLTHHLRMSPAEFDFDVCVPVAAAVAPTGRVVSITLPAVRVARTIHRGAYEGLAAAWGEFGGWITANGHVPGPDLYERYLTGPDTSPDPAQWRTELSRPLSPGA
ncbi:MAG: GyrI-like domain-containing protein [Bryobacteraceae bacterium]